MTYDIFMLNRNGVFSLYELPVILMKYLEFVSVILKHRCCRACIYYFIYVRKIKDWFFKCNISWPSSYLKNIEIRGWEKEKEKKKSLLSEKYSLRRTKSFSFSMQIFSKPESELITQFLFYENPCAFYVVSLSSCMTKLKFHYFISLKG